MFSSVTQLCPTLCDPMDCSTPGLPVHQQLPSWLKLMSIESVMPSNYLILHCPPLLLPSIFASIRPFPMSPFFTSGGQSIEVSASTSVLPMTIQDWSPLGWTGWISLQSKGLSRVALVVSFKMIKCESPNFVLFWYCFACLGPLKIHMNLRIGFSIAVKKAHESLIGVAFESLWVVLLS